MNGAKRYYFASDVHLGMGEAVSAKARERLFVTWLDSVSDDAKAIYLLGDIFDFWFEYRRVVPKGFVRTLSKLSELTDKGVEIHLFTGNHDMWMYDYLEKECGVVLHFKPEEIELCGKKLFLAHGDNMKVGRKPMLKLMNTVFRSRSIRWLFSWVVHPDLAMKFGQWWSGNSRKSHGHVSQFRGADEGLVAFAREYVQSHSIDYFIFGHIHSAAQYL